jgi:hypothetical protein
VTRRALAVALAAAAVAGGAGTAHAQGRFVDAEDVLAYPLEAEPPIIELYTFGRGALIFEKFGHAALCLRYHDPLRPPMCFNYGVTDFRDGAKLAWGFLRTQQKFWVEPEPLANLLAFYARHEDRTIWRQELSRILTPEQARQLEAKLLHDIKLENRYYYYDHFFDNCTTRIRDMIDAATGGKLRVGGDVLYPYTFRDLGASGLAEWPPLLGTTDFYVGRALDRQPTMWEAQFLPDLLREEVAAKLGLPAKVIYQRKGPPYPTTGSKGRLMMTLIAFAFALPLLLARWLGRFEKAALIWACVPLVFWGVLTLGVAIISTIPALRWNEALFLFTPLDLAIPFLSPRRLRIYARVRLAMVVVVSMLVAIGVLKQPLWVPILTAFLPFAILAFDLPWVRQKAADTTEVIARPASKGKGKGKLRESRAA